VQLLRGRRPVSIAGYGTDGANRLDYVDRLRIPASDSSGERNVIGVEGDGDSAAGALVKAGGLGNQGVSDAVAQLVGMAGEDGFGSIQGRRHG
jgi:hypothetical protein